MTPIKRYEAKSAAIVFLFFAIGEAFYPGWNGFFREATEVTGGESRIISAIYLVGAGLIWTR